MPPLDVSHQICHRFLEGKCPLPGHVCMFSHDKNHIPICSQWIDGSCARANSCFKRHFYNDNDVNPPSTGTLQDVNRNSSLAFTSPLVVKVRKLTQSQKRVEVDLDTGRRRSWMEIKQLELIDITGQTSPALSKIRSGRTEGSEKNISSLPHNLPHTTTSDGNRRQGYSTRDNGLKSLEDQRDSEVGYGRKADTMRQKSRQYSRSINNSSRSRSRQTSTTSRSRHTSRSSRSRQTSRRSRSRQTSRRSRSRHTTRSSRSRRTSRSSRSHQTSRRSRSRHTTRSSRSHRTSRSSRSHRTSRSPSLRRKILPSLIRQRSCSPRRKRSYSPMRRTSRSRSHRRDKSRSRSQRRQKSRARGQCHLRSRSRSRGQLRSRSQRREKSRSDSSSFLYECHQLLGQLGYHS